MSARAGKSQGKTESNLPERTRGVSQRIQGGSARKPSLSDAGKECVLYVESLDVWILTEVRASTLKPVGIKVQKAWGKEGFGSAQTAGACYHGQDAQAFHPHLDRWGGSQQTHWVCVVSLREKEPTGGKSVPLYSAPTVFQVLLDAWIMDRPSPKSLWGIP